MKLTKKQLQKLKELGYKSDYLDKNKFIKKINKYKKVPFEILTEYDFKKVKDRDRFLIDCIRYKNIEFYQSYFQNILDTIK